MLDIKIYDIIRKAVEESALASFHWIGKKNNHEADRAAVEAMRAVLKSEKFPGKITIGEGERDEAPMLYIGEEFSDGEILYDIAVDPLEGTNLCAYNKANSMSVMAVGKRGSLLQAPDLYMSKLATNAHIDDNLLDLNLSLSQILINIARAHNINTKEIYLSMLKRDRHNIYLEEAKLLNVQIELIEDGDILAAINAACSKDKICLYFGAGGAPEGVLAAAAIKCLGGKFFGKLEVRTAEHKNYATKLGISDFDFIYSINDLVRNDVIFAAAGVTDGQLLKGVHKHGDKYNIQSILMHYQRQFCLICN